MRSSRRKLIQATAASAAAFPVLNAQRSAHQHAAQSGAATAAAYKPKWATADEMKLIGELAGLIIPRTDTPGASDARVEEFIDSTLAHDPQRQALLRQGLKPFAGLSAAERTGLLRSYSMQRGGPGNAFFRLLKDLTIDGYYQSREGLMQELGWNGNTYLPEFKGCTHKEHQS
jgi:hypothetical protein